MYPLVSIYCKMPDDDAVVILLHANLPHGIGCGDLKFTYVLSYVGTPGNWTAWNALICLLSHV